MALDLNDPELEFDDLVTAYQSWVMAVINDEKLGGEKLLTDEITDDALNAMRFLPAVVTSAIETTLARVYEVDPAAPHRWDVYDREGLFNGQVHVSSGFYPMVITPDAVVGVWRDAMGVEHVRKYRLVR